MTEVDYGQFIVEFKRLAAALEPYKRTPEEVQQKADAYFHALKRFSFEDVRRKADRWLERESKMPKPAEWAGVIVAGAGSDLRQMTQAEATEHRRAERQGYEDAPCECASCIHAGVTHRPLRFVPEFDRLGNDVKVLDPIGNRVVVAGHWAHGAELARWYVARDAFWTKARSIGGAVGRAALQLVQRDREPGEDDE